MKKNFLQTPSKPGVLLGKTFSITSDEARSVGWVKACVSQKNYSVTEKLVSRIKCSFGSHKNSSVCQQSLWPHTSHPVQCHHKMPAKEDNVEAPATGLAILFSGGGTFPFLPFPFNWTLLLCCFHSIVCCM